MIGERELVAWLVIMRHNLDDQGDGEFFIPREVRKALVRRGWCTTKMDPGGDGSGTIRVTDSGCVVSDLAAPEFGIDPCPAEVE